MGSMKITLFFLLFSFIPFESNSQNKFPYNLNNPTSRYELPEILNEVSGLTDIDSVHIACVQDEIGTIFIYNFLKGEIVSKHKFDSIGDFEGLTFTGKNIYILRSDGRLTEWSNFKSGKGTFKHFMLPLQTGNNEGLCFDKPNNRLLIAAKSKPLSRDHSSERYVYAFDLSTKKLSQQPVYILNVRDLEEKVKQKGLFEPEINPKGKPRPYNFRPASLSVHPITNEIYIISAVDRLLIVMNRKTEITHIEKLNPEIFPKAEGITFLDNGTMIITNEAATKVPTLLVYKVVGEE